MEKSDEEGFKSFQKWKEHITKEMDEELEKEIEIFKIDREDKDIKEKLKSIIKNEKLLERSATLSFNQGKNINVEKVLDSISRIRNYVHFYVTLGYMRKQERLNHKIVNLTTIVVIIMILQILFMLIQINLFIFLQK